MNEFINTEVQESATYIEVKEPYGFVYITTNVINGKRYLGQKMFSGGWQNYLGSGLLFKKSLDKYGKENFTRNIVQICFSAEELNQAEYELSVLLNVVESDEWYNLVLGGGTSRGWHPREETKSKISEKTKQRLADPTNHPMYGSHFSKGENNPMYGISPKERMDEETYKQWYEKHKKYWANPSTKGKHIWNDKPHPNLGKKLPDKQKEKISNTRKTKHIGCKPVYSIELDQIFWGSKDVENKLNIPNSNIVVCCKGKVGSAGRHPITNEPLHWLYVEDQIQRDNTIIKGAITLGYITKQDFDNYLSILKEKGNDIDGETI